VRRKGGPVVHSIQEVAPMELLRIELADGSIEARIEGLEPMGTPGEDASRAAGGSRKELVPPPASAP